MGGRYCPKRGGGELLNYLVDGAALTYEAGKIREKLGNSNQIQWDGSKGFGDAIASIQGGGAAISIADASDSHGGVVRTITAVDISNDTVAANKVLSGYTAHDSTGAAITGSYVPPTFTTQTKSATPSESAQTIAPDSGYDGLSSVSIDAISSDYVGTNVTRRSSTDLTASGATISVPAGYYAEAGSKAVASGSATTPATTIAANPTISVSASGLITATASATQSITPTVSAGYVSSGTVGTVTVSGSNTEQLSTQAAITVTPDGSSHTIGGAGKYMTGAVTVSPIPSEYIVPSGTKSITENGTGIDVSAYAAVDVAVTSKNIQYIMGRYEVSSTSYIATNLSITVSKAGSYKCYWSMDRNTTSGTTGTQLYKNGSAVGSAHTSWTYNNNNRSGMNCEETLTLAKNDVVVVRARSRSTSYICGVSNFIIVEQ